MSAVPKNHVWQIELEERGHSFVAGRRIGIYLRRDAPTDAIAANGAEIARRISREGNSPAFIYYDTASSGSLQGWHDTCEKAVAGGIEDLQVIVDSDLKAAMQPAMTILLDDWSHAIREREDAT